jgi:hypothetical protein
MDDIEAPILPDAHVNGTGSVGTTDGSASSKNQTGEGGTALKPGFLAGLATAMRKAATRERDRITGVVAEDAAAHIEKVRARAAIETEELRRLAEEDVEHVEQWSVSEIERIKSEATQRIDDRRASLEDYLKQHDAIIETEIERVDAAVREYGETLDRFFADLGATTDPADIARRAEQLPAPPDLDEVRSAARASAMARLAEMEDDTRRADATSDVAEASMSPIETSAATVEDATETIEAAAEPVEAVADVAPLEEPVEAVVEAEPEPVEATAETPVVSDASADSGDGGTMIGVVDDGAGSVEPDESMEPVAESEAPVAAIAEETPVEAAAETPPADEQPVAAPAAAAVAATPEPVGVMDQDSMRAPAWPAPAPTDQEPARIAPTIDHTSAAVRLLRSVAPWTAPTHAGSRSEGDSE